MSLVNFEDIRQAHQRIGSYIHRTPVLSCAALDRMAGAQLHFKCENFQKIGAFKIRGATNAVFLLSDHSERGCCEIGVALAAPLFGPRCALIFFRSPHVHRDN